MRKVKISIVAVALALSFIEPANANLLPKSFLKLANSPALAHPGIIVIDPNGDQTLFSDNADTLRAPASVLKLVSMTAAVKTMGPDKVFNTSIYSTSQPDTYALIGDRDPWLTATPFEATKYHRAFSPALINAILKEHPGIRTINLDVNGVYSADLEILKRFYRHHLTININQVSPVETLKAQAVTKLAEISSPPLKDIVQFTLLWSDNILADRLARTSAMQMGLGTDVPGIQGAFEKTLGNLGISTSGLQVFDGNGLSHETKITTRTIADLLLKIKSDPDLKVIYEGLPLAGKTGTLKTRFVKDAPKAVGLVKAKTGWINTSVSLAGYVDVGNEQYVFAVIADHVKPYERYRAQAREAIDKMLATIAKPTPSN
jgi:D-alanyl-D-alanine carboxypeptidase